MPETLNRVHSISKSVLDRAGDNPATRKLVRTVSPFLINAGIDMVRFNLSELDKLPELVESADPEKSFPLIFIATTHESHADVTAMIRVASEIRARLPQMGVLYSPIAKTLEKGTQNGISHTMYKEIAEPNFARLNMTPLYMITPNDVKKRGEKLTLSEAKAQKALIDGAVEKENSAFLALLEGTVESGRHDKYGQVFGMQEVTTPLLKYVVKRAREIGREIIIAPFGMSATYRLLSAEMIWLTSDSFGALIARMFRKRIVLAEATAGTPFILDHKIGLDEVTDLVMRQHVAPLIPEKERGFYL